MSNEFKEWEDFEKELNITPEQEEAIQEETNLIKATIGARKKKNISQRELSKLSGVKQPVIARIESRSSSPQITTLLKILNSIGYTLKIVPLEPKETNNKNLQ